MMERELGRLCLCQRVVLLRATALCEVKDRKRVWWNPDLDTIFQSKRWPLRHMLCTMIQTILIY